MIEGHAAISTSRGSGRLQQVLDPWTLAAKSLELQAKGGAEGTLSESDLYDLAQMAMTISQRHAFNERFFNDPFGINLLPGQYDPIAFDQARPDMERLAEQSLENIARLGGPLNVVLPLRVRTGFYTPERNGDPLNLDPSRSLGKSNLQQLLTTLAAGNFAMGARIADFDLRTVPTVLPLDAQRAQAVMGGKTAVIAGIFMTLENARLEAGQLLIDVRVDRIGFYADERLETLIWTFRPDNGWGAGDLSEANGRGDLVLDGHAALMILLQADPGIGATSDFQTAAFDVQATALVAQSRRRDKVPGSAPILIPELVARGRAS